MDFEWDENKDIANQKWHGVSFLEAGEVFADELSSCVRDPDHSEKEEQCLLFRISKTAITLPFHLLNGKIPSGSLQQDP